ncbi:FHA domain-containing protein FHA2-like [Phalaenopsis equestris]|uniref:FHA domain-containing protein FHA2-like n=1 Tax=Phalaenopsis equestris TaxID=78828 RepID=UPI0009E60F43|nr:FHA domain-containing protein FHA2-like [Phalaenopsis equestris]
MASSSGSSGGREDPEVGFAKLQGEDFEYYMQTYSIVLGRNSKRSEVDVDLAILGGGMSISRKHARIFYDFTRRRFALEVLGKNGCLVEGVLHLPGTAPVKLDSQDLLQIGDKKFYFLLPSRSLFASSTVPRHQVAVPMHMPQSAQLISRGEEPTYWRGDGDDGEERYEEEEEGVLQRIRRDARDVYRASAANSLKRSRANREADDHQLMLLEEKDVLTSVASILSYTCHLGEWMSLAKLHNEMVEQYGNLWHHSRIRRYLTSEDWPQRETTGRPWYGLSMLLRKYPEHFVINTRTKGGATVEFVSMVSPIS